jgi:hypothetical protein
MPIIRGFMSKNRIIPLEDGNFAQRMQNDAIPHDGSSEHACHIHFLRLKNRYIPTPTNTISSIVPCRP